MKIGNKTMLTFGLGAIGAYTAYRLWMSSSNTPATIKSVVQNWVDTVCRHNPQEIVNLYAPDGVLLGTIAENMKVGREQIIQYFNMFVEKKPCGKLVSMNVQNIGSDVAIADGTYIFELIDEEGEKELVPARYTFVLRRYNGMWKIASHHSSAQPTTENVKITA